MPIGARQQKPLLHLTRTAHFSEPFLRNTTSAVKIERPTAPERYREALRYDAPRFLAESPSYRETHDLGSRASLVPGGELVEPGFLMSNSIIDAPETPDEYE